MGIDPPTKLSLKIKTHAQLTQQIVLFTVGTYSLYSIWSKGLLFYHLIIYYNGNYKLNAWQTLWHKYCNYAMSVITFADYTHNAHVVLFIL